MTDKEKLEALLREWDVPFKEDTLRRLVLDSEFDEGDTKVVGYMGFFAAFEFSADGAFLKVGFWE